MGNDVPRKGNSQVLEPSGTMEAWADNNPGGSGESLRKAGVWGTQKPLGFGGRDWPALGEELELKPLHKVGTGPQHPMKWVPRNNPTSVGFLFLHSKPQILGLNLTDLWGRNPWKMHNPNSAVWFPRVELGHKSQNVMVGRKIGCKNPKNFRLIRWKVICDQREKSESKPKEQYLQKVVKKNQLGFLGLQHNYSIKALALKEPA